MRRWVIPLRVQNIINPTVLAEVILGLGERFAVREAEVWGVKTGVVIKASWYDDAAILSDFSDIFGMLTAMNRLRAVLLPLVLLLAACAPDVPELPSEEVLRRATLAAQATVAVAFAADGTLNFSGGVFGDGEGQMHAEGLLQDSGDTIATTINLVLQFSDEEGGTSQAHALVETILVSRERLYLLVRQLESPSLTGVFDPTLVSALIGTWWIFDAPEEAAPSSVTPSAALLQAQASVVQVTRDLGVTSLLDIPVYHYAVAIDPDRFLEYVKELHRESEEPLDEERLRSELASLQATGELWIRADNFSVLRMAWDIPALPMEDRSLLHLAFTLDWKNAAGAPPIVIPSDARPFSAGALVPAAADEEEQTGLPEGIQVEDIRSAIQDVSDTAVFPPAE